MAVLVPLILIITGIFLGLSLRGVIPGRWALATLVVDLFPCSLLAILILPAGPLYRVELLYCTAPNYCPKE
jgi:hypothetical protein